MDIYKCPFFKKIMKFYFSKKNTIKKVYKTDTIKGIRTLTTKKSQKSEGFCDFLSVNQINK